MNSTNSGTSPGGEKSLRSHWHVDDDSISLSNSMLSEKDTHFTHVLIDLSESESFFFLDHVRNPDKSLLVRMLFQVAIEHVVCDVNLAVWVPAGELWDGVI